MFVLNELIQAHCPENLDSSKFVETFQKGITDNMSTQQKYDFAAETAASFATYHPDWSLFAGRILMQRHHEKTEETFFGKVKKLRNLTLGVNDPAPLIDKEVYEFIKANKEKLEALIDYSKDFTYDIFAVQTLMRAYLLKIDGEPVERIQDMLMRVAVGIHYKGLYEESLDAIEETYEMMSSKQFTHATPTLFNAGTPTPQLSSCFLLTMKEDSIEGIFDTAKQCGLISKTAGGIGLSIHDVRAQGSYIRGTNGYSNGIVPMLKMYNEAARYVDQGGGKRKGSFAIYLEPWHADIFEFLDLKKNHGKEELRARDLFYAMWTPDLFMERVKSDGDWSLFCPNQAKGLSEVYGKDFKALYEEYEAKGMAKKTIKARKLWEKIVTSQIETGTPYMLYKDAANEKSNQKNLGTIKSSNLCTEILEYTSPDEVAVCNLASISLPSLYNPKYKGCVDYEKLHKITKRIVLNLNAVIDVNHYPVEEGRNSNLKHRPIGIGVQGLADLFHLLELPFTSEKAKKINRDIFEVIYFAALQQSMELAKNYEPYSTFEGSPASKGVLQFDMWGAKPTFYDESSWNFLRSEIVEFGLRNSLLVAPMPTASTSQILGNNESFEPYTSNMYLRRVLSGEFIVSNKHLVRELIKRGLWTESVRNGLIRDNGSVQNLDIPEDLKERFKTVWEISQKELIDMSADRGAFICQSQSFNLHIQDASVKKLTSAHFYGFEKGLKTGMYYLRTKAAVDTQKVTVEKESVAQKEEVVQVDVCRLDDPDCLSCGA